MKRIIVIALISLALTVCSHDNTPKCDITVINLCGFTIQVNVVETASRPSSFFTLEKNSHRIFRLKYDVHYIFLTSQYPDTPEAAKTLRYLPMDVDADNEWYITWKNDKFVLSYYK